MKRVSAAVSVLLLLWCCGMSAAERGFPVGRVIRKVECKGCPGQSYALFLPSSYDSAKRWPILYIFDPAARGWMAVDLFKDAAERWGYILAGSNNSRNGPWDAIDRAVDAVWKDTHRRLSIDPGRVYAGGFSGGARVAGMLAFEKGLRGLIAFGAGFPNQKKNPDRVPFVMFLAAGLRGFNLPEVLDVGRELERMKVPHRVVVFKGVHQWPPREICEEALEWLHLYWAKARGDGGLVSVLFSRAMARARAYEKKKEWFQAYDRYKAMMVDFKGTSGVTAAAGAAKRLESSPKEWKEIRRVKEFLDAMVRMRHLVIEECRRLSRLLREDRRKGLSRIRQLRTVSDRRSVEGEVARRVLQQFNLFYRREVMRMESGRDYDAAASALEILAEIAPSEGSVWLEWMKVLVAKGDKGKALDVLKRAVAAGFRDFGRIEKDPVLSVLKAEDAYRRFKESLKSPSR